LSLHDADGDGAAECAVAVGAAAAGGDEGDDDPQAARERAPAASAAEAMRVLMPGLTRRARDGLAGVTGPSPDHRRAETRRGPAFAAASAALASSQALNPSCHRRRP